MGEPRKTGAKPGGGIKRRNGRPEGVREYIAGLIGERGEKAYDVLWEIAQGTRKAKRWLGGGGDSGPIEVETTPSVKEQHDAAALLLERLQGKAAQPLTGADGEPLTVLINTRGGK